MNKCSKILPVVPGLLKDMEKCQLPAFSQAERTYYVVPELQLEKR